MKLANGKKYPVLIVCVAMCLLLFPPKAQGQSEFHYDNVRAFSEATAIIMKNHFEEPVLQELFAAAVRGVISITGTGQQINEAEITNEYKVETTYDVIKSVVLLIEDIQSGIWGAYDEISDKKIYQAAVREMLNSLGPENKLFTFEETKELQAPPSVEHGGIGIAMTSHGKFPIITNIFEGAPAFGSGIIVGDRLIEIDGRAVEGMSLMDVLTMLRGPEGTQLSLTIDREDPEMPLEFTLARRMLGPPSSIRVQELDPYIGYVAIDRFNKTTNEELVKTVESIHQKVGDNFQGLILDLRNNQGGLLISTIEVVDNFIDNGSIVVTRGRSEQQNFSYNAAKRTLDTESPLIVLINRGTASGAEIVAGALQYYNRAILVGTRTHGGGTIQTFYRLGDGSSMRLTTAYIETPGGIPIHNNGVAPNYEVRTNFRVIGDKVPFEVIPQEPSNDDQLQKALELLGTPSVWSMVASARNVDSDTQRTPEEIEQLNKASDKFTSGEYSEALGLFLELAEQGDVTAQFYLGAMYAEGLGTTQDHEEAVNWYRKAAIRGSAVAQIALGTMYKLGQGVSLDDDEAMYWFSRAVRQEGEESQFKIGFLYYSGTKVPQDYPEAAKWFIKAAEKQNNEAQYYLGVMCANGLGFDQDNVKAYMWLKIAEDNEHDTAKEMRKVIEKSMTRAEKKEAKKLAKTWRKEREAGPVKRYSKLSEPDPLGNIGSILFGLWIIVRN